MGMSRLLGALAALCFALSTGAGAAELRVLTWAGYLSPDLVRKFEAETGVRVSVDSVIGYVEMVKALERQPAGYDVSVPADFLVADLIRRGLIERIDAPRLPFFDNIELSWRSRNFDPRDEYTVPHLWGTTSFVVDSRVYKGDIDTLKVLFEPPAELRGHIGFVDAADVVQLALKYLGLPRCSTDPAHLDRVQALLKPLARRAPVVTIEKMVDMLSDPKVSLAVAWNGDAFRARLQRPTLRYAYPREGSMAWTDVWVVPKNPPNRASALAWLSFMLRPENAALQSNFTGYASMIRGAEKFMAPELIDSPEIVAPAHAKLDFTYTVCDGRIQLEHETYWRSIHTGAGKR